MNQHGVDYVHSRITLRFSITRRTTIFQMVLLLRCPEGMQHTTRLHLTVMTCPTIMSFITFRLMPLIPSCKLIIIHPLFGLSTWIAVVASYLHDNIYNLCWTIWVPCKYSCHIILASKATSLLGFITVALSQSGVSDQHNSLVDSVKQSMVMLVRKRCPCV